MKKTVNLIMAVMALCMSLISCNNKQTLGMAIKIANQQMPKSAGQGLMVEKIAIEGDYVTYYVSASEEVDLDAIEENMDFVKPMILEQLKSEANHSNEMKTFFDLCKSEDKGIAYKYIQEGRSVTLSFESHEL